MASASSQQQVACPLLTRRDTVEKWIDRARKHWIPLCATSASVTLPPSPLLEDAAYGYVSHAKRHGCKGNACREDDVSWRNNLDLASAHGSCIYYILIANDAIRFCVGFRDDTYRNNWDFRALLEAKESEDVPAALERYIRNQLPFRPREFARQHALVYMEDTREWYAGAGIVANMKPLPDATPEENPLCASFLRHLQQSLDTMHNELRMGEYAVPFLEFYFNPRDAPILYPSPSVGATASAASATSATSAASIASAISVTSAASATTWDAPTRDWMPTHAASHRPVQTTTLLPVLSQYTHSSLTADIPAPVIADLDAAPPASAAPAWEQRHTKCIWRGSATGAGATPESNPRLHLASIRASPQLLDAKLTSLGTRDRVDHGRLRMLHAARLADVHGIHAGRHNFVSMEEQRMCKFAIYVEGNSAASRLGAQLKDFCVLKVGTRNVACADQLWFMSLLQEGVHFIGVRSDLSDLDEKLHWCANHDDACKRVAQAASQFYANLLAPERSRQYLCALLSALASDPSV